MGSDVSGPALCGARWLTAAAGEQHLETPAHRPSPPDSARLPFHPCVWRAEIVMTLEFAGRAGTRLH